MYEFPTEYVFTTFVWLKYFDFCEKIDSLLLDFYCEAEATGNVPCDKQCPACMSGV